MSFVYSNYAPILLVFILIFAFIILKNMKAFNKWVEDHWFYRAKSKIKVSNILYVFGFSLLLIGLLDLRGPEENIVAKTSELKTVILIDISASMLAQDLRPNRIGKAIMLAKHYIKKAVGQQIAVMVFSDNASKLVPFTKDINLLEARIDGIKTFDMNRGGSGLSIAVSEAIQYFKTESKEIPLGNILVFSDAEESEASIDVKVPDTISVGFIGIGTAKGSSIPLVDNRGANIGTKKHNGEVVITKLDEENIKRLADVVKNFKYWIVNTYSIPTDKVLDFFQKAHKAKLSDSNTRVRPVAANNLLIPALLIILMSYLLRMGKNFYLPAVLILLVNTQVIAEKKDEKPKKTKEILELEAKLKNTELDNEGRKYLAEKLLGIGASKEAATLYKENLEKEINDKNILHQFNKATAELQSGDLKNGLKNNVDIYNYLENKSGEDAEKLKKMAGMNILKALEQQQQGGKGESKEQNESEDKDQQNQDQSGQGKGQQKDQKENKDQNKGEKDKKDQQDQNQGKDKENDDKNEQEQDKKNADSDKAFDKEKMPALLKQLLSDDNKLQKQLIDADTKSNRSYKDW